MLPARCKPEDHARVWKAEQWICSTCFICGCEPELKARGPDDARQYETILSQKIERDRKVRGIVLS